MIIAKLETEKNFEKIVSGELTFITDAGLTERAIKGDFIAINVFKDKYTGRCCLVQVSDVVELEDCYVYAIQPCRIETHRRLTAAVYGEKES